MSMEAMLLALTILSPVGQKILADRGFRPVALPSELQARQSGVKFIATPLMQ